MNVPTTATIACRAAHFWCRECEQEVCSRAKTMMPGGKHDGHKTVLLKPKPADDDRRPTTEGKNRS